MSEIKPIDIPLSVASELERLHELISSDDEKIRDWAMSKVDKIHEVYFKGSVVIGNGS